LQFRDIPRVSEAIHRHVLSATELQPTKCTFQRCIDCVDIARRSSARASNNVEMAKTSLHTHTAVARLPGVS